MISVSKSTLEKYVTRAIKVSLVVFFGVKFICLLMQLFHKKTLIKGNIIQRVC